MIRSIRRGLKSRQPGMVEICFSVNGTGATPAASGQDAAFVQSVVDNGTGDYTITLKEKALQNLVLKGLVSSTARAVLRASAVSTDSVTVTALRDDNTAMDADFSITLNFASQVPYYF